MTDKKYLDMSNTRLKSFCETRVKTCMIGSLDIIEKSLSDLWDKGTPEALELRQRFDTIRQEILDNGNRQIRLLDKEFSKYVVELIRYHVTLINGRAQKQGD